MQPQLLVLVSICMLVSSCCKGVRPEDANLFQATCGIFSGEFNRQLESDISQAASSRQGLDVNKTRFQTLKIDREIGKAELKRLSMELDEMENESHQLEAQIKKMGADSVTTQQELKQRLTKLKALRGQLEILKQETSEEQITLRQYRAKVSRLKQEIDILRMLDSYP